MQSVDTVTASAGWGLVGDRYYGSRHRQVTVQASEELALAAACAGRAIDPGSTRRNITITGAEVPRTGGHRWSVGGVRLEVVRDAAPCRLMEDIFGEGVREHLTGRAGVACRVLDDGEISVGDPVDLGASRPAVGDSP